MLQTYLDADKEQFLKFMALPIDSPLKMLNLLKFKAVVEDTGKSGEETYQDYMEAAKPFFSKVNVKISFYGTPQFNLIGPDDLEWDKILIAEYATREDFVTMVTMDGYPAEIRNSALVDSRLVFCK